MNKTDRKLKVLHIANWYPNPWDNIEGNFVRDQIRVFKKAIDSKTVVVQVRESKYFMPKYQSLPLDDNARGYFIFSRSRVGKITELISSLLLFFVLIKERAWKYNVLHFHIAYPLLIHCKFWKGVFKKNIVVSEHWSAYHYNFYLPQSASSLGNMRKIFNYCDVIFPVSNALMDDIKKFTSRDELPGVVISNVVPLQGSNQKHNKAPILFAVNRWRSIKNPMPMLEGLEMAAQNGEVFNLVIGGFGDLIDEMNAFVNCGLLKDRTIFLGKMTKEEISYQLSVSDGYLFSSDYETFSIACAEALGAGVPLIGPYIPAISEYASQGEWVAVRGSGSKDWCRAVSTFLSQEKSGFFVPEAIAAKAENNFSEENIKVLYQETILRVLESS